ncbi:unnamed protein product, partial [Brenthis ino]
MSEGISLVLRMSPSSVEVIYKYSNEEFSDEGSTNMEFKSESQKNVDYYYQALPKTDPKFLAPLRRWEKQMGFVTPIRWTMVLTLALFHILMGLGPIYYLLTGGKFPMWKTFLFALFIGAYGGFGVTGGVHRYWTHRSYKAKLPLKIILMIGFAISGQNNIMNWVRDHRVHHKLSETTADPHDAHRGFFFAHVGWLMMKKHPHVISEGNKIDMSDILNDPVVQFHTRYFALMKVMLCIVIPTLIPIYFWGESPWTSIMTTAGRYVLLVNMTWSVNSFAHIWGNKPYNTKITPVENWKVSLVAMGEGWHNYHHTFPWDYKAAELAYFINITTLLIDMFAAIGWAYDMKKASPSLIQAVVRKRGPQAEHHRETVMHE